MPPRFTILNTMSCLVTGDIDIQHWHWYAMITPVCSLFFLALVWDKYCAAIYFVCNVHFKSIKPKTVCAYNIPRICFTMFIFVSINEAVDYWMPLLIHVWIPGLMSFRPQAVCRALCQLDQLIDLVFSRLYVVDQCQRHVNWMIQVQTFCFLGDNGTDHHRKSQCSVEPL